MQNSVTRAIQQHTELVQCDPQMQNRRKFWNLVWKWLLFFSSIYFIIICIFRGLNDFSNYSYTRYEAPELELYKCPATKFSNFAEKRWNNKTLTPKRILILSSSRNSNRLRLIVSLLNYLKVQIRIEVTDNKSELILEIVGKARFGLIIFEDYLLYHKLSAEAKNHLLNYCKTFKIGLISFLLDNVKDQHFAAEQVENIGRTLRFMPDSPVNFIAKTSIDYQLGDIFSNWTNFIIKRNVFVILGSDNVAVEILIKENYDVSHIIFGHLPDHWILKLALLDAIAFIAPHVAAEDLERYIQIDIDDVFLGQRGTKFTPSDVNHLVAAQSDLRRFIDDFTFLLGFSGYFFRHGEAIEVAGDEELLASANKFLWFPHMWRHNHAYEYESEHLRAFMTQNKMFAMNMNLNLSAGYAISPQHSGVYPIHQPLYDAWRSIWNVSVTSTEEYPHFRPASLRRAFVHGGVFVLPRQICGLFTHTIYLHAYPDAIDAFYENIFGGKLFETVLMNKFSIFMTHQQNYANDRLGTFTFQNLVRFLGCWTNLRLKWRPPNVMARMYFDYFVDEEAPPYYTNFCADPRHRSMLLPNSTICNNFTLPNVLVVGPQKTGTSALSLFLSLHPDVSTNRAIPNFYEELQFFNGANYARGPEWYAEKFSHAKDMTVGERVVFEKSANYFDSSRAPAAAKSLLPDAKIIFIFTDPVDRAYSWYQHMRSHNDTVALKFDADHVLMSNLTITARLRQRCLGPGLYAKHLDNWLDHYPASQLIVLDGHELRHNPIPLMLKLVERLGLSPDSVDYAKRLAFGESKGFYCVNDYETSGKTRCLGRAKGRKYAQMSEKLRRFLSRFYEPYNRSLKLLLQRYDLLIPSFLSGIQL